MKKTLFVILIICLCLPVFCQYGNMNVIEPRDVSICSESELGVEGNVTFNAGGYMGVFVSVQKDSRVKLTVSAKSEGKLTAYPVLRLTCGNKNARFNVNTKEYSDYSANFTLAKGVYFLKAENLPLPKEKTDKRQLDIERIYVSGNQLKFIPYPDEKTLFEAAKSTAKMKMKEVAFSKKHSFKFVMPQCDYGINVVENVDRAYELEKIYRPVICDKNEEDISGEYTFGYANGDDPFAKDLCERIHILIKDKADTKTLRLVYTEKNPMVLFKILNMLALYDMKTVLFDYDTESEEKAPLWLSLGFAYGDGMVFNEKNHYIAPEDIDFLQPEYKGTKQKKFLYDLFPGEYKISGQKENITVD